MLVADLIAQLIREFAERSKIEVLLRELSDATDVHCDCPAPPDGILP